MARTDVTALELPQWAVPREPRAVAVAGQSIKIRTGWWRHEIESRGLPGRPPEAAALTRAEVVAADIARRSTCSPCCGTRWRGARAGTCGKTSAAWTSIAEDVAARGDALTEAAEPSATTRLRRTPCCAGGTQRHQGLGPSFFTKFLYFAGGGAPDHPCLILDRLVATALRDHAAGTPCTAPARGRAQTYPRYCDLLARWARERHRAPDEFERTLFTGTPPARGGGRGGGRGGRGRVGRRTVVFVVAGRGGGRGDPWGGGVARADRVPVLRSGWRRCGFVRPRG